ncbi:hypothetical protein C8J57DRAFT_1501836 [Mycena rebaudengoi]|nr:hypothetical protein C8J57DRAFT_1542212 [Mycena rebaudengoi]KAJ7280404.1 hypothetical protein C8J57DRAFT_1501836 [Mycena rebaudengoi]
MKFIIAVSIAMVLAPVHIAAQDTNVIQGNKGPQVLAAAFGINIGGCNNVIVGAVNASWRPAR